MSLQVCTVKPCAKVKVIDPLESKELKPGMNGGWTLKISNYQKA